MSGEQAIVGTWGKEGAAALVAAQLAAGDVEKRGNNAKHGYRYASSEDIIAASDVLAQAGLSLSPESARLETFMMPAYVDGDGVVMPEEGVIMLRSTFRLEHGPTGQTRLLPWECPVLPHKGMALDKAMAAARTYSLGYLLRDLLLLPRVEAGTAVDEREAEPPRREVPPRAPRREAAQPAPVDKPTASELHFAEEIAQAPDMERLGALRAEIKAAGFNTAGNHGGERLAAAWSARRLVVDVAPPREPDWGDRAALITRHVDSARSHSALEIAASELQAAQAEGMPAALVAPISMKLDAKRQARAPEARNGGAP